MSDSYWSLNINTADLQLENFDFDAVSVDTFDDARAVSPRFGAVMAAYRSRIRSPDLAHEKRHLVLGSLVVSHLMAVRDDRITPTMKCYPWGGYGGRSSRSSDTIR